MNVQRRYPRRDTGTLRISLTSPENFLMREGLREGEYILNNASMWNLQPATFIIRRNNEGKFYEYVDSKLSFLH